MNSAVRSQLLAAVDDERADLLDALASSAADGDITASEDLAWAILHLRLARPSIRRYLLRDADIEVAEQRTLIAVALRVGAFRGDSRFTTWLYQVAGNEAKQLIRSEARHRDRTATVDVSDESENFVARVSSMVADADAVRRALAAVPDRHRHPLELREQDGLTYEEIAGRLDVPVSTAKTWVRRGRAEMAAALADQFGPTDRPPGED